MWYGNALARDQCNKIRDTENSGGSVNWPCKRYRALVQKTSVANVTGRHLGPYYWTSSHNIGIYYNMSIQT